MFPKITFYDDPRGYYLRNWPNKQTGFVAGLIYINGVTSLTSYVLKNSLVKKGIVVGSEVANATLFSAVALNIPLRALAIHKNVKEKKYINVALNVAAFSLLFFPYGRLLSLSFDCASEVYALYEDVILGNKKSLLSRRLDPTILENAYKILTIPEDKQTDAVYIIRRYAELMEVYIEKRPKIESTLTDQVDIKWQDINDAYSTVKENLKIN